MAPWENPTRSHVAWDPLPRAAGPDAAADQILRFEDNRADPQRTGVGSSFVISCAALR